MARAVREGLSLVEAVILRLRHPSCITQFETETEKKKEKKQVNTDWADMKRRSGNGIEGAMVCTSLDSLLRPLFYFLSSHILIHRIVSEYQVAWE